MEGALHVHAGPCVLTQRPSVSQTSLPGRSVSPMQRIFTATSPRPGSRSTAPPHVMDQTLHRRCSREVSPFARTPRRAPFTREVSPASRPRVAERLVSPLAHASPLPLAFDVELGVQRTVSYVASARRLYDGSVRAAQPGEGSTARTTPMAAHVTRQAKCVSSRSVPALKQACTTQVACDVEVCSEVFVGAASQKSIDSQFNQPLPSSARIGNHVPPGVVIVPPERVEIVTAEDMESDVETIIGDVCESHQVDNAEGSLPRKMGRSGDIGDSCVMEPPKTLKDCWGFAAAASETDRLTETSSTIPSSVAIARETGGGTDCGVESYPESLSLSPPRRVRCRAEQAKPGVVRSASELGDQELLDELCRRARAGATPMPPSSPLAIAAFDHHSSCALEVVSSSNLQQAESTLEPQCWHSLETKPVLSFLAGAGAGTSAAELPTRRGAGPLPMGGCAGEVRQVPHMLSAAASHSAAEQSRFKQDLGTSGAGNASMYPPSPISAGRPPPPAYDVWSPACIKSEPAFRSSRLLSNSRPSDAAEGAVPAKPLVGRPPPRPPGRDALGECWGRLAVGLLSRSPCFREVDSVLHGDGLRSSSAVVCDDFALSNARSFAGNVAFSSRGLHAEQPVFRRMQKADHSGSIPLADAAVNGQFDEISNPIAEARQGEVSPPLVFQRGGYIIRSGPPSFHRPPSQTTSVQRLPLEVRDQAVFTSSRGCTSKVNEDMALSFAGGFDEVALPSGRSSARKCREEADLLSNGCFALESRKQLPQSHGLQPQMVFSGDCVLELEGGAVSPSSGGVAHRHRQEEAPPSCTGSALERQEQASTKVKALHLEDGVARLNRSSDEMAWKMYQRFGLEGCISFERYLELQSSHVSRRNLEAKSAATGGA